MSDIHLSKSRFCKGVQCPKILWLDKNCKEEFDDSVMNQSVLTGGNEVGDLAMGLFGEYKEVPFNGEDLGSMIPITKEYIDKGIENICEASFSYENCFCSVDILRNLGNNSFELYEVKSSTELKDIYLYDVAYQYYVLKKLGMNVKKACLVHINKEYVRHKDINLKELFTIEDITSTVDSMFSEVEERIKNLKEYIAQEKEPEMEVGCQCTNPYECGYWAHCAKNLPIDDTQTVFNIRGRKSWNATKMYQKGIITFNDILKNNLKLNKDQKLQVETEVYNLPPTIDKENIKNFLKSINYPIYYLDFETYMPAVPPLEGTSPYNQIVTQYSLHIQEKEGGELIHKEFLAYPTDDMMYEAGKHLCEDIPYGKDGSVIVYNAGFEPARIRQIINLHPEMEKTLQAINDRIIDLAVPFRKRWYYAKDLCGSYSIKYVLPSLCPNDSSLDYSKLEGVHNGGEAMAVFAAMKNMNKEELEVWRDHLLKYCCLDTLAMVKIIEKLKEMVKD